MVEEKIQKDFILEIKPSIPPEDRHKIEDVLSKQGYEIVGGGTMLDGSSCDICFSKKEEN